jgi:hypothetical protein
VQNANLHLVRGNESLWQLLGLLEKVVLALQEANKAQMQDIAEIREGRSREATGMSRLAGENASLAPASKVQKQEICALEWAQVKSDKELLELRTQLAQELANHVRERERMKRKMAELREA